MAYLIANCMAVCLELIDTCRCKSQLPPWVFLSAANEYMNEELFGIEFTMAYPNPLVVMVPKLA